jgi:hypothetical protein
MSAMMLDKLVFSSCRWRGFLWQALVSGKREGHTHFEIMQSPNKRKRTFLYIHISCLPRLFHKVPRHKFCWCCNHSGLFQTIVLKSTIFWNITLCSLLKVNRRFWVSYRLHIQGRINKARHKRPWRWTWYVPAKWLLTFNGLHGVVS